MSYPIRFAVALMLGAASSTFGADGVVRKTIDTYDSAAWTLSQYNTAVGTVARADTKAPDAKTDRAMKWDVSFTGDGFQGCQIHPGSPKWIPGNVKNLTFRYNISEAGFGMKLNFVDGWGRSTAEGQELDIEVRAGAAGEWDKQTVRIPNHWVRPIRLSGVTVHNWSNRGEKKITLLLDDTEVETDISKVDPKTGRLSTWRPEPNPADPTKVIPEPLTPLVVTSINPAREHNVFVAEQPSFTVGVQSWLAGELTGNVTWTLLDDQGKQISTGEQDVTVADTVSLTIPLSVPRFGWYQFQLDGKLSDGSSLKNSEPLVYLPKPIELSEADKDASPYGLNVLAARKPMVGVFKNAGIVWFRDYGFDYEWMIRAKGTDKSYSAWPWYPPMVKMYDSHGVRVMACLKSAIKPPRSRQPDGMGPDANWKREITNILNAFPSIKVYELDNEYDLSMHGHERIENETGWENYRAYHRVFGQLVDLIGGGEFIAAENGRAGIWPNRVKACIESGDFNNIQVVNTHHYTGTEPPETNVGNHNMGLYNAEDVLTFYDQLRAVSRIATSDGKPRQHWLTEFGWDTRAGPIVTPFQQAVYLQRGFMLTLAAGCQKAFWFFDVDAPKATQIFDGMGLMTDDQRPNRSLASMAGLTQILPRPQYVGNISAGDDTRGYLFKNDGKLVATLFTVDKPTGPSVNFEGAQVFDYLANPVESSQVTLTPAPVFAVGVSTDSVWFRQSAYLLKSPILVTATSGDTITSDLQVRNDRTTPIRATVTLDLPAGWTAQEPVINIMVEPGQTSVIPVSFRVTPDETIGEKSAFLVVNEDQPLIRIPLRVRTQEPIGLTVRGLRGAPGKDSISVRVVNRSTLPLDGTLTLELPAAWSTPSKTIDVKQLLSMEPREISVPVTWTTDWKADERAVVKYLSVDGRATEQPIIPPQVSIHRAPALVMDGDLSDWPTSTQIPGWMLGSTDGPADVKLHAAWSEKGLYVAAVVGGSKVSAPDPKQFWDGDALEVFVDTRNKKDSRKFEAGDHQFFLVPQVDQKDVYLGRWKRQSEIPATLFDIATESASKRTEDGYVIEALIPADQFQDFSPSVGTKLGMNLNLKVVGVRDTREVYWSQPKEEGTTDQPGRWGTVLLVE